MAVWFQILPDWHSTITHCPKAKHKAVWKWIFSSTLPSSKWVHPGLRCLEVESPLDRVVLFNSDSQSFLHIGLTEELKKKKQRMPGYLPRIIKSESLERWVEKKHFIYIFFYTKKYTFFFFNKFSDSHVRPGWDPLYLQELNANKKRHTYLFQFITFFLLPFFSFIRVIAIYIPKPQLAPPQSSSRTCDATRF